MCLIVRSRTGITHNTFTTPHYSHGNHGLNVGGVRER
jgi:hypothetical protein